MSVEKEKLQEMLTRYKGEVIDVSSLPAYTQFCFNIFVDERDSRDPYLALSASIDVTDSMQIYMLNREKVNESFACIITWFIASSLFKQPACGIRYIDGVWYQFNNLPLFIPIATGRDSSMVNVFVENFLEMTFEDFCYIYRSKITAARNGELNVTSDHGILNHGDVFRMSNTISYLPNVDLNHFEVDKLAGHCTRTTVYFSRYQKKEDKYIIPLTIGGHHSTVDGGLLIKTLNEIKSAINAHFSMRKCDVEAHSFLTSSHMSDESLSQKVESLTTLVLHQDKEIRLLKEQMVSLNKTSSYFNCFSGMDCFAALSTLYQWMRTNDSPGETECQAVEFSNRPLLENKSALFREKKTESLVSGNSHTFAPFG